VIGASALPLLIGSAGLAVDTVQLSLAKRQMQRAADSAALAGAHAIAQNKDARQSALHDLKWNNSVTLTSAPVVEPPPTSGKFANMPRTVRVLLSTDRPSSFMSIFTKTPTRINVEATAQVVVTGRFCMISLERGNVTGITFTGSSSLDLGCGVATNSRSAQAIRAEGSAALHRASPVMAVGGIPASTAYKGDTLLVPYAPMQDDPFSTIPDPAPTNCQPRVSTHPSHFNPAIEPGCYRGMDLKGTVTLNPGIYFIQGNSFSVSANAVVTGTNVTIVLTGTAPNIATVDMHANGTIKLTATADPNSPYDGVLFYQDRRATDGNSSTINGGSNSTLEGALYFPRAHLTFNGNSTISTTCMQLVAKTLRFSGNTTVTNSCPANGARHREARLIKLVG
jgi:hypothetical protein